MSQPGEYFSEIAGSNGTMDDQSGSSKTDERCLIYRLQYHLSNWLNECSANLDLDLATITPTTGYTPGTYEDVWLLPKNLVSGGNDTLTCILGPIVATVVIDSNGTCTSITPTMKNGQYFTGETLVVQTGRSTEMGTGSGPIEVDVLTGSEGKPNLAGSPYWSKSTSWSIGKWFTMAFGRNTALSDCRWMSKSGVSGTGSSGSTTWYNYNIYTNTGWNSTKGRGEIAGSNDSVSTNFTNTFNNTYAVRFYYNSEPGQEVFVASDSQYFAAWGWVRHDTTNGYYGNGIMNDWSLVYGSSLRAMQIGTSAADPTSGTFSMAMAASISREGYVKPWRTLEAANWVIAGGNTNLVTTGNIQSRVGAVYTTGDGSLSFRQITKYMAGRVS